jgi:hypothetical protein
MLKNLQLLMMMIWVSMKYNTMTCMRTVLELLLDVFRSCRICVEPLTERLLWNVRYLIGFRGSPAIVQRTGIPRGSVSRSPSFSNTHDQPVHCLIRIGSLKINVSSRGSAAASSRVPRLCSLSPFSLCARFNNK